MLHTIINFIPIQNEFIKSSNKQLTTNVNIINGNIFKVLLLISIIDVFEIKIAIKLISMKINMKLLLGKKNIHVL